MRFLTTASLLGLAAVVFADEAASEAASDVLNLTAKDYDTIVNAEPLMLVEFFAPWCGHCKALAPHYEEAATALKDKGIKLAKVDCVDQADFCQEKGVQGYPTLKVTRNGEAVDYSGPRKADGIISYMTKQSLPAVSEVTSANHDEFQKSDKIVAIAYLSSTTETPAPVFSAVAEAHRDDYLFGITTDQKAIDAAGVKPPAIVVYRSFDEPKSEYPYPIASVSKKDVVDWIKDLAVPIIDEVNGENYGLYANSGKPLAYLFVDPSLDTKDAIIEKVKPVAAKYKSKVNFVWIDAVKFGDHAKALNIAEVKWPAFVIQNLEKQLKYPLDQSEELSSELVEDWVSQYVSDKLQPELKSQPIPPTQDEPVFTLVGKHFEEVVFDDSKDVFVEFYAPWCGHCKRLAPIWDSVGLKYKPIQDKILIAKMDATENDLPPSIPFRISGFPTLKFKPAGGREWVDYEGDRSIESLLEFIEKNAKNSLELPVVAEDAKQVPLEAETSATPAATSEPSTETHDEL